MPQPRTTKDRAQNSGYPGSDLIFLCFSCLGGAVTQSDVAQLVGHYAGHLAFSARGFDHAAVYKHRPAWKGERVYVARVDDFESVTKLRVLKLWRD